MLRGWLEVRERRPRGHALPQRVEPHEALAIAMLRDHLLHIHSPSDRVELRYR